MWVSWMVNWYVVFACGGNGHEMVRYGAQKSTNWLVRELSVFGHQREIDKISSLWGTPKNQPIS